MQAKASATTRLVKMFCTPPSFPSSQREMNALEHADRFSVRFDEWDLPCYAWGQGRTVLLCHGWGSRAGHMTLLASALARAGFRAVAFDAPAHSSFPAARRKETSNMLEFGRAIHRVARSLDGLHGLFGHSLGAIASLFAMAAFPLLEAYSFSCPKLILASTPADVRRVLDNFSRQNGLSDPERRALDEELQSAFAMNIADYECAAALAKLRSDALIVQDADDEYFPLADTLAATAGPDRARVLLTSKLGHNRVLASKQVFANVIEFLNF